MALGAARDSELALSAEPAAGDPSSEAGPVEWHRPGIRAELQGLRQRPELNGCVARLTRWDEAAGRWDVRLEGGVPSPTGSPTGALAAVKQANLRRIPEESECQQRDPAQAHTALAPIARPGATTQAPEPWPWAATDAAGDACEPFSTPTRHSAATTPPPTEAPFETPEKPAAAPATAVAAPAGDAPEEAKAKPKVPRCCYFAQGRCGFGEQCRFSHDASETGACQFGEDCLLGHHGGDGCDSRDPLGAWRAVLTHAAAGCVEAGSRLPGDTAWAFAAPPLGLGHGPWYGGEDLCMFAMPPHACGRLELGLTADATSEKLCAPRGPESWDPEAEIARAVLRGDFDCF